MKDSTIPQHASEIFQFWRCLISRTLVIQVTLTNYDTTEEIGPIIDKMSHHLIIKISSIKKEIWKKNDHWSTVIEFLSFPLMLRKILLSLVYDINLPLLCPCMVLEIRKENLAIKF